MGEARLWYETLGTVQLDWQTLRDHFCQQYSKFASTRGAILQCVEIISI